MSMKSLKGASALALLIGTTGVAYAQQPTTPAPTPAQPNQTVTTTTQPAPQTGTTATQADQTASTTQTGEGEKVVVIGSLIATLPEDAPKPVEVYTLDDLANQGSPTVNEFVRSLSMQYGDDLGFGQATPEVAAGAGFANANLRGLGSSGTLVLMNGRRTAAANGGFGADLNTVPIEALEAVEVLKDGASSTYGAGAVGGVINFRSRRDVDAPQFTISKRNYEGSDGQYVLNFLNGWVGDAGNILLTLSHTHEEPMLQTEREFSSQPFSVNPTAYSLTAANPGRMHVTTNFLAGVPGVGPVINDLPGNTGPAAQAACEAIGGQISNVLQPGATTGGAANTGCAVPQYYFQDLISENDNTRVYAEANMDLSDSLEFHMDVSYSDNVTYFQQIPFGPAANRATAALGGACGQGGGGGGCRYVVPVEVNTYTTAAAGGTPTGTVVRNPFIDDWMARTGQAVANTGAVYLATDWRPSMYGGFPTGSGFGLRREKYTREQFIVNAGTKGEFTADGMFGFLDGITYDYNAQYSHYRHENQTPDISVARLQNALLGYGGPTCQAIDRVPTDYSSAAAFNRTVGVQSDVLPGTTGCQWFNPFASSFQTSVANGAANPQFNAGAIAGRPSGYQNPQDLWDWLIVDKNAEDTYESATFDATWTGEIPETMFALPGGNIAWALGTQWRMVERRSFADNNAFPADEELLFQSCPFPDPQVVQSPVQPDQSPGQLGCASATGAFFASGRIFITNRLVPAYTDAQNASIFGEVQLPVLDNVNLTASYRHEDFRSGKLVGDIWSVAGKWDITDNIWTRGSYSTNYRAEAALDITPGVTTFSTTTQGRFGGLQILETTTVDTGIGPEDDSTLNIGFGYDADIFEGRLRASIDFFEVNITGQLQTTPTSNVFNNVFGNNTAACQANRADPVACTNANGSEPAAGLPALLVTPTANVGQFANCNARLIDFVVLASPCVQGTTTAASLIEVERFQINGPYYITNGLDYSIDYVHPLFDGNLGFTLTATQNLHYKQGGYSVNGVLFDAGGDRLGFNNLTRTGSVSQKWRGNASIRWANDTHNINFRANYSSGAESELFAAGLGTLTSITPLAISDYGVHATRYWTYDSTYIYTAPFWEDLELRLTVLNILDEDPPGLQVRSGYFNSQGEPRGRIIEVGMTKKF